MIIISHTVTSKSTITAAKDKQAIIKAAGRLGYEVSEVSEFKLFQSKVHKEKAIAIKLPGWSYPMYLTEDGTEIYDNYGGSWGSMKEWDKFKNVATAEKQIARAKKAGYKIKKYEIDKNSGQVKLQVMA